MLCFYYSENDEFDREFYLSVFGGPTAFPSKVDDDNVPLLAAPKSSDEVDASVVEKKSVANFVAQRRFSKEPKDKNKQTGTTIRVSSDVV